MADNKKKNGKTITKERKELFRSNKKYNIERMINQ